MSKQSLEHIVNDLHHPNGMQHVFKDLEFLRQHESHKAFHRDLNHLNNTLHKQGLLPKFEVIDGSANGFAIRQKGAHPKSHETREPHAAGEPRAGGRPVKQPASDGSRARSGESRTTSGGSRVTSGESPDPSYDTSPRDDSQPQQKAGPRPASATPSSDAEYSQSAPSARAGGEGGRVAFFGDSITKGMTASPDFKRYFGADAENFGHNGDSTDKLMSRLKSGEDSTPGKSPDKGVILIGTNDLGSGKSDHQIAQGVLSDLAEAERLNPGTKFLVVGLLPRGQEAGNSYRQHIANINRELGAALAGNSRAKFADIGAGMLEADGNMSNRLWQKPYGYVHPTMGAGYDRLLTLLKPQVDAL